MKTKKSKLQQIREDIIADIRTILEKHSLDEMDIISCGSTPVIWPSADDQDFDTYTLDRVYVGRDNVLVDSSSSDASRTDRAENLGTDTLVNILEFLEDNEELIWEENEEEDGGEPRTFLFTVNASGKKVKFAPGNLYWDGKEFRFEKHQYDCPTGWKPDHIGHFFWSKDVSKAVAPAYDGRKAQRTDKFFATDGRAIEGYTVLSGEEWGYLFANALAKNSSSLNTITIDGKRCIVLKPDGFTGTVKDSYTAAEWVAAEASGLVALPFAGFRFGSSFYRVGSLGYYWSSTPDDSYYAWDAYFYSDNAYVSNYGGRDDGRSVRLVSVQ